MRNPIPPQEPLPPELARRIEALESTTAGGELDRGSWFWLVLFGMLIPALLLLWGWWA